MHKVLNAGRCLQVHGVVFVVDSADSKRLDEVATVFHDVTASKCVKGKPILVYVL